MAPILLQFFHEVEETEYWMETIMSRMHLAFHNNKLKGDKDNLNVIDGEMKVSVHYNMRGSRKFFQRGTSFDNIGGVCALTIDTIVALPTVSVPPQ